MRRTIKGFEKIFEENGVEWKDKEKFLEKNETEKRREIFQSWKISEKLVSYNIKLKE